MPDTSEDIVKTESKAKPRNKKGFREPTSLHVDPKLWQEVRVMAVLKNISVTEYFEDALRRKLDADNLEVGRQGYQVGHGGMYIPPPPASVAPQQPQQSQQLQQSQQQEQKSNIFNEDTKFSVDDYSYKYQIIVPKIKYPIDKKGLIQHIKNFQNEFNKRYKKVPLRIEHALFLVENLPYSNKIYRNGGSLENDLEIVINKKKIVERLVGKGGERLIGCTIANLDSKELDGTMMALNEKDYGFRRNYEKYFRQEYEKQKATV